VWRQVGLLVAGQLEDKGATSLPRFRRACCSSARLLVILLASAAMSSYRTEWRDGVEAVIADDDRIVGIVYEVTGAGPSQWIGRSTNQSPQFATREEALQAVIAYADK
jgi:hypothetical protein